MNILSLFRRGRMGRADHVNHNIPHLPDAPAARQARGARRSIGDYVGDQAHGMNDHAQIPRRVGNRAPNRDPNLRFATMKDLRVGNEPDHDLPKVPVARGEQVVPIPPPVDAASADLRGRAYLQFVVNDAARLHPSIRLLIESEKILQNPNMNDQQLEELAERLRPVISQACHDPELADFIEDLASEASIFCGDRTDYFIGRMQDATMLSTLTRNGNDSVTLYNAGISFCKLEQVRDAVFRQSQGRSQYENVHAYLDAEYYLQETLELPTRHERPAHYMNQGVMTEELAHTIGEQVKASMSVDDGDKVMDFMSTWGPWKEDLRRQPNNSAAFAKNTENYHSRLERIEAEFADPNTLVHQLGEAEYLNAMNKTLALRECWDSQLAGQITRKFLLDNRADILLECGVMPEIFQNVR